MSELPSSKHYDLEERTLEHGKRIIRLAKSLPKNSVNLPLVSQIIRSGTSVGANYREANETTTHKDFLFRMRICRKEAKETTYWLNIISEANPELKERITPLLQETLELTKIIATIIINSEKNQSVKHRT